MFNRDKTWHFNCSCQLDSLKLQFQQPSKNCLGPETVIAHELIKMSIASRLGHCLNIFSGPGIIVVVLGYWGSVKLNPRYKPK